MPIDEPLPQPLIRNPSWVRPGLFLLGLGLGMVALPATLAALAGPAWLAWLPAGSALGLGCAGLGLTGLAGDRPWLYRSAGAILVFLGLVAVLNLLNGLITPGNGLLPHANRVQVWLPVNTGLALLACGVSLGLGGRLRLAPLVAAYLGLETLLGHLLGAPPAYAWFGLGGMTLGGAVGLCLAAAGALLWAFTLGARSVTDEDPRRQRGRILGSIVGIMVLATLLVGFSVGRVLYQAEVAVEADHLERQAGLLADVPSMTRGQDLAVGTAPSGPASLVSLVARMEDGRVRWLGPVPIAANPHGWPYESMRRALSGRQGRRVDPDLEGRYWLSVYRPLPDKALGMVLSLPLDRIRVQFLQTLLLSGGLAALVIVLAALWVRMGIAPLVQRLGEISALRERARCLDMEVRERTRQIGEREAQQRVVNRILAIGLEERPLAERLQACLAVLFSLEWLGFHRRAALFVRPGTAGKLRFAAGFDLAPGWHPGCDRIQPGECLCGLVVNSGERLYAEADDPRHTRPGATHQPHAHLILPLKVEGRILGLLNLYPKVGHRPTPSQQTLLEALASALAGVVAKAEAEEALRRSEERFALAVEGATDGIWDWDLKADRVWLSARCAALLGMEGREAWVTPEDWTARIHADDRYEFERALRRHLAGDMDSFRCEYRLRTVEDGFAWRLSRGMALRDPEGHPYRLAGSTSDISGRKAMEQDLMRNALHDSLTGLANRVLLGDRLQHVLDLVQRQSDHGSALLFLDLDRFKLINDSLGHLQGDRLLEETGRRLSRLVRDGDTVARLGGDEFVVLLEGMDDTRRVEEVAQRILAEVAAPLVIGGNTLVTSASIGVVRIDAAYTRMEEVLRDADTAMYAAKAEGGNCRVYFRPEMRVGVERRFHLEHELRLALDEGQFELFLQPIVTLADGRVAGFEALLRWRHRERGLVPPVEFIPLAEETGLILPLGRWVLTRSLEILKGLREECMGGRAPYISLNVSPRQLADPDLGGLLARTLETTGVPPEAVRLEVTESALMANPTHAEEVLGALKDQGVKLSMDDFGTGYSSLSYLHRFPMDVLKIDRSFVGRIQTDARQRALVDTMLGMATHLEMDVVAEGIEEESQCDQLKAMGCIYGQGYLFSRPLPVDEALAFLQSQAEAV